MLSSKSLPQAANIMQMLLQATFTSTGRAAADDFHSGTVHLFYTKQLSL